MRDFIEKQIAEFDGWTNAAPNGGALYQDGNYHIELIQQRALELGFPEVVEACQKPGYGVKHARQVLAACLAACPEPEPATLTPPEIAKQLGVAPETVVNWIKTGQLKGSNLATDTRPRYVVTPADLATFLESRQPQPPAKRQPKTQKLKYRRFSE